MLDARERAKARSLLDPSDPPDAKAVSPPISDSDIRLPPCGRSPPIYELGFPIAALGAQPSALSPQRTCQPLPQLTAPRESFRFTLFLQCNSHQPYRARGRTGRILRQLTIRT